MQRRRRETHSTRVGGKRYIWCTDRLWKLARELPEFEIEVESIRELDRDCWFGTGRTPTIREVAGHCKRINEVNPEFPVILNEKGGLMDGGHRLARALLEGSKMIKAVQFAQTPEPDVIEEICQ